MHTKRPLFDLEPHLHYMNGAAYSPLPIDSIEAGMEAVLQKGTKPYQLGKYQHFTLPNQVRQRFAELVHCTSPDRIALIPSVSYGLAVVARNLEHIQSKFKKEIILIGEDFPNNIYTFEKAAKALGWTLTIIDAPDVELEELGEAWNEALLSAISEKTACVVVPLVHWTRGIRFEVENIGKTCQKYGALHVIDGSQGIGVVPFSVWDVQPDALLTTGYKWLMGAYGSCLGYFGRFFDEAEPIEESWMNRVESDDFSRLTRYLRPYRPEAQRYNQGEFSNFIATAILNSSLRLTLDWGVENIYKYSEKLTEKPIEQLKQLGCQFVGHSHRTPHLLSVGLPPSVDIAALSERMKSEHIFTSLRGAGIRVSTHVYNTEEDWQKLVQCIDNQ